MYIYVFYTETHRCLLTKLFGYFFYIRDVPILNANALMRSLKALGHYSLTCDVDLANA